MSRLDKETRAILDRVTKSAQREAEQLCLPLPEWDDLVRGVPSAILRSALFGVVRRGKRPFLENSEIAAWPGVRIQYNGQRLDQADLDVWMQAIHLSKKGEGLGDKVGISLYSFLKGIGRNTGKSDRDWLKSSLTRLISCAVTVDVHGVVYSGNLVREYFYDSKTTQYFISVNPRLAPFFNDHYTRLSTQIRIELKGDLARWLHGYICSHRATYAQPHRIGVERLKELCGSERETRKFQYDLAKHIEDLVNKNVLAFGEIEKGVFKFVRV